MPTVIAHRGYALEHPENSLRAIKAACEEAPADGIEFDLRHTLDQHLLLHHDRTLQRCCADPNPAPCHERNWLGDVEHVRFTDHPATPLTRLPDLLHYLRAAPPCAPLTVIIDVKDDQPIAVLGLLLRDLTALPPPASVDIYIGVWCAAFLHEARRLFPAHKICWISEGCEDGQPDKPGLIDAFDLELDCLSLAGLARIRTLHPRAKVFAWTCNSPQQVALAHALHVDAILTDDPFLVEQQ